MSIYAGRIDEIREGKFERDGEMQSIVNLVIASSKKLVGDITIEVKRTAVLFQSVADKALSQLSEGDHVVLTEVVRNPRVYTTQRGTEVETVEINMLRSGGFEKLTKKLYENNKSELASMMLQDADFDFTDADRAMIAERESVTSDEPDDDNVDEVFA